MQVNTDPMLRPKEWPPIVGISIATIYRMIESGEFPKPTKLGKQAVGLRKSQLEAWIKQRETLGAEQE
jgi:predicted DNA-binding transcriptional regulator AlpA